MVNRGGVTAFVVRRRHLLVTLDKTIDAAPAAAAITGMLARYWKWSATKLYLNG
jgi:hypothetical protein